MIAATDRSTANDVFQSAAMLAQKGQKVVRLYGIRGDGSCTCDKGHNCTGKGKHPVGDAWQHLATDDENEIASWFENDTGDIPNIGLLLGDLIDVECDGDADEGEAAIAKYGLDKIDTPAFRSSRGIHRLFRRVPGLPAKSKVMVGCIEVRLGGENAAQSVVPPSLHAAGVRREWLPGRSPEDCDFQPLPEKFRKAVIEKANGMQGGGLAEQARRAIAQGKVFYEGEGRHEFLLGSALHFARRAFELDSKSELEIIAATVGSLNETKCRPPYPPPEIQRLVRDAIQRVRDERLERDAPRGGPPAGGGAQRREQTPWERMGLQKNPERPREYFPGTWKQAVVNSDPKEIVITGIISPSLGEFSVSLTTDEFMSGRKVAKKILAASGDCDPTNPNSASWCRLWEGFRYEDDNGNERSVPGLKSALMEACEYVDPSAETKRYAYVAGQLLNYLRGFDNASGDQEDDLPNPSGVPKWRRVSRGGVARDELWLKWNETWDRIKQRNLSITHADSADLRKRLLAATGEDEFQSEVLTVAGTRGRWRIWTDAHIHALEEMAGI
jgi:hypothetical protein